MSEVNIEQFLKYLKDSRERNIDAFDNDQQIIFTYINLKEMDLIINLLENYNKINEIEGYT